MAAVRSDDADVTRRPDDGGSSMNRFQGNSASKRRSFLVPWDLMRASPGVRRETRQFLCSGHLIRGAAGTSFLSLSCRLSCCLRLSSRHKPVDEAAHQEVTCLSAVA